MLIFKTLWQIVFVKLQLSRNYTFGQNYTFRSKIKNPFGREPSSVPESVYVISSSFSNSWASKKYRFRSILRHLWKRTGGYWYNHLITLAVCSQFIAHYFYCRGETWVVRATIKRKGWRFRRWWRAFWRWEFAWRRQRRCKWTKKRKFPLPRPDTIGDWRRGWKQPEPRNWGRIWRMLRLRWRHWNSRICGLSFCF